MTKEEHQLKFLHYILEHVPYKGIEIIYWKHEQTLKESFGVNSDKLVMPGIYIEKNEITDMKELSKVCSPNESFFHLEEDNKLYYFDLDNLIIPKTRKTYERRKNIV